MSIPRAFTRIPVFKTGCQAAGELSNFVSRVGLEPTRLLHPKCKGSANSPLATSTFVFPKGLEPLPEDCGLNAACLPISPREQIKKPRFMGGAVSIPMDIVHLPRLWRESKNELYDQQFFMPQR